jgi:hypothetical protein
MTRQLSEVGRPTREEDRTQPYEEETAAEAVDPLLSRSIRRLLAPE